MEKNHSADTPGKCLGMMHKFAMRYFTATMDEMGLPRATVPFLLPLLRHDDVSQDDLADKFMVDRATVGRRLEKLEQAGLVEREIDADDRRIKRVRVTEKAREFEPRIRDMFRRWNEKLTAGFEPDERQQALAYLQRMAENAHTYWQDAATDAEASTMTETED